MADLSREARGGRTAFFQDADVDRLLAMLTRLVSEHWALRERVAVLEKLLADNGVIAPDAVETFAGDADWEAGLDAASARLIRDVMGAARNIES